MGVFEDTGKQFTEYVGRMQQRWNKAREDIGAQQYDVNKLATDIATTWLDGMDFWTGLTPTLWTRPLIPVVYIQYPEPAGTAAVLPRRLPPGPPGQPAPSAEVTPLVRLGGTETITGTASLGSTDTLVISLQYPNTVAAGVYQGVAHLAGQLLAVVIAHKS